MGHNRGIGSRAFSVAAPRLWNELPLEIRSAKTQISLVRRHKTYTIRRGLVIE